MLGTLRNLQKMAADIRRLILEGEPADASWKSSFSWPRSVSQVRLVNPDVMVNVGTARATRETIYQESKDDLLFMTSAQIAVLVGAINGLRGNNASITTAAPADLMRFISGYLPSEVSQFGGVLTTFATVPAVQAVAFLNAERTEASVGIRTSFSGGTLRLGKQDGAWRVIRVEGAYIQ